MELKFNFSVEEANLILEALGELPAKRTMLLIQKIQRQAMEPKPDPKPEQNQSKK